MRLKSTGKALVLALTVTSALALSGCATAGSGNVSDHAESTHGEAAAGFSSDDIMFAQMMIPHHQQAVDLGTLAETRAQNPDVIALAAQIKAEQAPEIEQMKSWLAEAGAPLEMGHSSHMNGMLTEEQMQAVATYGLAALTTAQIGYISTNQLEQLTTAQITAFDTAQLTAFTTTQITSITADAFTTLSESQIANLTTAQVSALTKPQLYGLTATRWGYFTTAQEAILVSTWGSEDLATISDGELGG
jgi:uncharacterized protein (DUF305 family)